MTKTFKQSLYNETKKTAAAAAAAAAAVASATADVNQINTCSCYHCHTIKALLVSTALCETSELSILSLPANATSC